MTGGEQVVITCALDRRYVRPLAAMLRSVADNLESGRAAKVYIIHSDVPEDERAEVMKGWPERISAEWIAVDESAFAGLPLWGRMPVSTYFKLAITDLLPETVSKAIWLDCDLLVLDDIGELWDRAPGDAHVGAVQDVVVPLVSSRFGIESHRELGIDSRSMYFNAGVMAVNVTAWRADSIPQKAIEYLRRNEHSVTFWDQEGLNAALAGKWVPLEPRWNHNAGVPRRSLRSREDLPSIIHFAGGLKPWRYRTRNSMRSLYYEYLDRTAFAGWRPPPSAVGAAISFYEESGLRAVMYPAENLGMRVVRDLSR